MLRETKRSARLALRGGWGRAVALFVLPLAVALFISMLESLLSLITGYPLLDELAGGDIGSLLGISPWTLAISLGGALLGFILLVPLNIGTKRWYLRLFAPEADEPLQETAAEDGDTIIFEPVRLEDEPQTEAARLPEDFSIDELFSSGRPQEETEYEPEVFAPAAEEEPDAAVEACGESAYTGSLGDAFDFFASARDYFGALWLRLVIALRCLGWLLLFSLPGGALLGVQLWLLGVFSGSPMPELSEEYLVLLPAALLLLFSWMVCGVFLLRYFAAEYVWADSRDGEHIGVHGAIKLSVKAMRGNRLRIVGGTLSFAGWWLLCLLVLPAMYVCPYFEAYKAAFVREALKKL